MRILFVTSTRIGDAVQTTGVLDRLLRDNPGAKVTVAVGPVAAQLFRHVPGLERLIEVRKKSAHWHWVELWSQVCLTRWDLVVDLRASGLAYFLWVGKRRVGRSAGDKQRHRVVELAELFGYDPPPVPTVWLSETERAKAADWVPEGGPVIAVAPAANWRGKQWRVERFAELMQRLTAPEGPLPGARVAVIAAEPEREQAAPVLEALPQAQRIDLIGTSLLDAGACMERCRLFIGNDSGLMHISAAVGTPTLGLFGPSSHQRYHPWSEASAYVCTQESPAELMASPDFDHRTTDTLMDGLTVDAVAQAARDLLARTEDRPGKAQVG